MFPVIKHFAFDERIIRECRDLVANSKIDEVLRLLGYSFSLIVLYKEFNRNLTLKICIEGKVFTYC